MAIFSEEERLGLSLKCFVRLNDDKFIDNPAQFMQADFQDLQLVVKRETIIDHCNVHSELF